MLTRVQQCCVQVIGKKYLGQTYIQTYRHVSRRVPLSFVFHFLLGPLLVVTSSVGITGMLPEFFVDMGCSLLLRRATQSFQAT